MGLREYRGAAHVFVRVRSRDDMAKLVSQLVSAYIPFEVVPVPEGRYELLVKKEYGKAIATALDTFDIEPVTTGTVQEVVLETTKVYKYEGVNLHDV